MKQIGLLALILTLIAVLVWVTTPKTASEEITPLEAIETQIDTVDEVKPLPKPVKVSGVLYPELKRICACESAGRPDAEPQHFEADGVTVRYGRVNPLDIGMCQINLRYHEATAVIMGLDVFLEADNIAYANWLYETQGTRPWRDSSACWSKGLDTVGKSSTMIE